MQTLRPLRAGLAVALTIGLLDLLTAVAAIVSNDVMPLLFSTWWHGIDVGPLAMERAEFGTHFAWGVLALMGMGFVAGVACTWIYNRLARTATPHATPKL